MKRAIVLAAGALVLALNAGLAQAKLPVVPMDDAAKAKAAEAAAKHAAAVKQEAEALAKAEDRAVENYKRGKGLATNEMPTKKGAKARAGAKK